MSCALGAKALPHSLGGHKAFTYRELQQACGGFSPHQIVGEGGFGNVYKGELADGSLVAIKRLDRCGLQARAHRVLSLQSELCEPAMLQQFLAIMQFTQKQHLLSRCLSHL